MSNLQISNPHGINLTQSLKDWAKIDNINKNGFWSRKSGGAAMLTIAAIGATIAFAVVMNIGVILYILAMFVVKLIIAALIALIAALFFFSSSRNFIKMMFVGFFESLTLEYVRRHPMVAFSAFWSFIVDLIQNVYETIGLQLSFQKQADREIEKLTNKINNANTEALNAEKLNDDEQKISYLNLAQQLTETKMNFIKIKQLSQEYVDNANIFIKRLNTKKIVTEHEIDIYKTKHTFNDISTSMINAMQSAIFPNPQTLKLYNEAKDSIDKKYDDNMVSMQMLMNQFKAIPSAEALQNPALMSNALQQFESWKKQSLVTGTDHVTEEVAVSANKGLNESSSPTLGGIRF